MESLGATCLTPCSPCRQYSVPGYSDIHEAESQVWARDKTGNSPNFLMLGALLATSRAEALIGTGNVA